MPEFLHRWELFTSPDPKGNTGYGPFQCIVKGRSGVLQMCVFALPLIVWAGIITQNFYIHQVINSKKINKFCLTYFIKSLRTITGQLIDQMALYCAMLRVNAQVTAEDFFCKVLCHQ